MRAHTELFFSQNTQQTCTRSGYAQKKPSGKGKLHRRPGLLTTARISAPRCLQEISTVPASGDPREDRQSELQNSLQSGAEAAKRQERPDLRDEKSTLVMEIANDKSTHRSLGSVSHIPLF